ncbi:MAG: peptidoglycan DD-metalloendopeptidase family protein [Gammaproteobacteria bacterium]|nr:peptidoglycan DD-metalloendopeptidase family protein [Gammaproteobacteria bacterium]
MAIGDTLSSLFSKQGLAYKELLKILALGTVVSPLKTVFPGDELHFSFDDKQQLQQLSYPLSASETLLIKRAPQGHYQAERVITPLEVRQAYAQGTITHSLFLAAQEAGISQATIMELANIFGWDIDFVLDVREGDRFSVVYETLYKNGEKIGNGKILAAEFVNRGTAFQAVLYQKDATHSDYYSPNKRSLRKTFLRSPVEFSRISSRFTNKRYHPVLKRVRAHRGVDYAAAKGTPIRSTGDGKIIFRGRKGGYGRTVVVQHGQRYTTLYAHMSSYNRKLRSGSRIRQGEVIGYVGMSGTATGYHLHYEFRLNGTHRNPLTVKLPDAEPLPQQYHADFDLKAQPLLSQLNTLSRYRLALKD